MTPTRDEVARLAARLSRLEEENPTLIEKVARFVACERVGGDYLEFGVYRGDSLLRAWRALEAQFSDRIALDVGGGPEATRAREERRRIWAELRLFGFDSFAGLPELQGVDKPSADFEPGMYAADRLEVLGRLLEGGVPKEKLHLVEGSFEAVCTASAREALRLRCVAIVWIDSDLFSSCRTALEFVSPLLQEGTVLVFDDYFSYRGSPRHGEQGAFNEWRRTPAIADRFDFIEYQRETWKRVAFLTVAR